MTRRNLFLLGAGVAGLGRAGTGAAQGGFPNRPVQMVVPFDAGGGLDLHARALGPALEGALGQPVVVLNRPGATGAIGLASVARGAADGYTIAATALSIVTAPEVDRLFGRTPAFELDSFAPLGLLSTEPLVVVVRSDSPHRSLADLVRTARQRPGEVTYSSAGNYGPSHLATEILAERAGGDVRFLHVPFTGSAPALNAVVAGTVAFYLSPPSIAVAQAERLRPLAVTTRVRHPALPDVPTAAEAGIAMDAANWYGLVAPAATPAPVLATLRRAVAEACRDPRFLSGMARINTPPDIRDAEGFAAYLAEQAPLLRDVVRRIGRVG
ncbi:MAG: tripartite tricarboxylate transporter substrate binding protein [Rhodovarius sp.]|nr:tripartite tricarboxylate transporter substrate binding protein [Rhodovarius sp.]